MNPRHRVTIANTKKCTGQIMPPIVTPSMSPNLSQMGCLGHCVLSEGTSLNADTVHFVKTMPTLHLLTYKLISKAYAGQFHMLS